MLGGPSSMLSSDQRARQQQEARREEEANRVRRETAPRGTQTYRRDLAMGSLYGNMGRGQTAGRGSGGSGSGRGRSTHADRVAAARDVNRMGGPSNTGTRPSGWSEGMGGRGWQNTAGWSEGRTNMDWQRFQDDYVSPGEQRRRRRMGWTRLEQGPEGPEIYKAKAAEKRTGGSKGGIMQTARIRARERAKAKEKERVARQKAKVVSKSSEQRKSK